MRSLSTNIYIYSLSFVPLKGPNTIHCEIIVTFPHIFCNMTPSKTQFTQCVDILLMIPSFKEKLLPLGYIPGDLYNLIRHTACVFIMESLLSTKQGSFLFCFPNTLCGIWHAAEISLLWKPKEYGGKHSWFKEPSSQYSLNFPYRMKTMCLVGPVL